MIIPGGSEENIRELFKDAYRTAPSIIFIDEIDAIASKRENLQREMERRIVTQLMTCMDESHQTLRSTDKAELETSGKKPGYVLVIGATNRPDALDPALRRPGRFDREIAVRIPDENARLEILSVLAKKCALEGDFDLIKIARSTPGFVGADLKSLVNKAGNLAMKRIMDKRKTEYIGEKSDDWLQQPLSHEELESVSITMSDFEVIYVVLLSAFLLWVCDLSYIIDFLIVLMKAATFQPLLFFYYFLANIDVILY